MTIGPSTLDRFYTILHYVDKSSTFVDEMSTYKGLTTVSDTELVEPIAAAEAPKGKTGAYLTYKLPDALAGGTGVPISLLLDCLFLLTK